MASLSGQIKERAAELGLHDLGIVAAGQLGPEAAHFEEWLRLGFHGEMAWMERDPAKRSDATLLMPEARSVIVTLTNYHTPHAHADDPGTGKISRYAWGDDYHDVLRETLNELAAFIETLAPDTNTKVCIDTAPFMDKAWAVRAGLGWLGKHSNLITTDIGSWVFIGSILTDLELDHDTEMVADHCGTCTRCLDACPTGAIVEPYVVDSRKCISYATIELRDETLPAEVVPHLNGWIYGCDICQDVCPWNRFETPTTEARFEPRRGETSLSLDAVADMDHDVYVERFRRSAMKRTKLAGLKRNAAELRRQ